MAIIEGTVVGSEAGFYPTEIEQSLRFNDDDSAYLSWTPASAGNRKTWTFSTWVKRGNIGSEQIMFAAGPNASGPRAFFGFQGTSDALYGGFNDGSTWSYITTNALFRDTSAWYHVMFVQDLTNATTADRAIIYVNGIRQSVSSTGSFPNADQTVNNTVEHRIGSIYGTSYVTGTDGYLAETHFIDGTAYDATAFGEFKNGVWIPKTADVTYGSNGFYLPYRNDYTVEGFSAITYTGNGSSQYIGGVGFEPDLVWIKSRSFSNNHHLFDSVRGHSKILRSSATDAESTLGVMTSFDSDGFTVAETGGNNATNDSGSKFVAWCWDAGTGSPVSNTDGSITSTVKANPSRGFSIVSYTGTASSETVGHGLSAKPDMIIAKSRNNALGWLVYHDSLGADGFLFLNGTNTAGSISNYWGTPDSSTFGFISNAYDNANGNMIAYCFHSVAGYSKMGSYTGTGAAGNTVTTGFRPAFVLTKMTSSAGEWRIHDSTRSATDPRNDILYANQSAAELVDNPIDFDDDGFTLQHSLAQENGPGQTYIYMAFADTREAAFWLDDSGNNNDWENNGLTESDISLDSPTNNFATLNSIKKGLDSTYSEGNLKVSYGSSSSVSGDFATIGMSSGKWYWEWAPTGGTAPTNSVVGIVNTTENSSVSSGIGYYPSYTTNGWAYTGFDGNKQNGAGTSTAYGATFTSTDIVGVAFDADAGELEFYKNGVSQGVAYTGLSSDTYYPAFGDGSELNTVIGVANFGQDSSFAGNKTPQGYTDANGIGDFYYAPPAGYLALCTANLPEPAIGPNSATTADENFNTVLWTGDGTSPRSITGVGFQPDLVWTKRRSGADSHHLFDVVRGTAVELRSDGTGAELTSTYGNLSSYDTDGFTVTAGANGNENQNSSGYTCVAWNWKADNTSGSTNTDGTITSTVSANVDAGFSIVSYTGTGSAATVGHGLSSAPEVVLIKNRSTTDTWAWYTTVIDGSNDFLSIDDTAAKADASEGVPTSTIFNVSGWSGNNGSGNALIAYCFHSVEGYSKFGSYTGNGSTDGPFVYTGFRPAFVMVKCTNTTGDWLLYDTERDTYNVGTKYLIANSSTSEGTVAYIDTLSNGFKLKLAGGGVNTSGNNYIFMSFASNPFKYSNAR